MDPLDEELAERGRALIAAAVAETMAPLALRERIEADRARAAKPARSRRLRALLPAGGLVAAAVVAVVLVVGGGSGAPSVLATAALATGGPVLPAPAEDDVQRRGAQDVDGGRALPVLGRLVPVGGRRALATTRSRTARPRRSSTTTRRARARPTRSSAATRSTPRRARTRRTKNGVKLFITTDDGRRIVTWTRNGHTCVLSAPLAVPEDKLLELAAWKGQGNVSVLSDALPARNAPARAPRPAAGGPAAARRALPARRATRVGAAPAPTAAAARHPGGAPAAGLRS